MLLDFLEVQVIFSFSLMLYGGNALQRSGKCIEKKNLEKLTLITLRHSKMSHMLSMSADE